uniref:Uncharacterized protein AlNc14C96G5876 n=1 Tax=Albugo laibachii Nc14 TaxID=890382 RepID=F0WH01_9STRA|nr:conserved hypothetical protein [Albugo laibachii Nc14]|eukprot:CCA20516.1 conserved hypothetical protein [Albugo laibachii Nc14]
MTIDSQKWSSYDETTTELEAKDVVNEQLTSTNGSKSLLSTAMYNRLLFGALVGFPTGAVFGAIDGIRTFQKCGKLSFHATNAIAKTAVYTGGCFSSFFSTFQGVKAAVEFNRNGRQDAINIGVATTAATIPFLKVSYFRKNIPYAMMLVALDYFHSEP